MKPLFWIRDRITSWGIHPHSFFLPPPPPPPPPPLTHLNHLLMAL